MVTAGGEGSGQEPEKVGGGCESGFERASVGARPELPAFMGDGGYGCNCVRGRVEAITMSRGARRTRGVGSFIGYIVDRVQVAEMRRGVGRGGILM